MSKIIQILKDEQTNMILGLGDNGVVYESAYKGEWVECIDKLHSTKSALPATTQKRSTVFKPPEWHEVANYMSDRVAMNGHQAKAEAEKFVDFYKTKGWMVGKNKMKDWKAAVRNWLKNYKPSGIVDMTGTSWIDGMEDVL